MGRPFFRKYTSTSAYRNAVSSVTFTTRTDGLLRNWANCAVFSAHRFPARNPLYNSPKTTADKQTVFNIRRQIPERDRHEFHHSTKRCTMHHRVMHCEWMIRTLIRIFSDLRPDTL